MIIILVIILFTILSVAWLVIANVRQVDDCSCEYFIPMGMGIVTAIAWVVVLIALPSTRYISEKDAVSLKTQAEDLVKNYNALLEKNAVTTVPEGITDYNCTVDQYRYEATSLVTNWFIDSKVLDLKKISFDANALAYLTECE